MSTSLVRVPFHGDTLEATQRGDAVLVSLRRCCENLSVDFSGQLQKLKKAVWACMEEISIHDTTGREQKTWMLSLDSLPMWLANIYPNKVAEHVRPKLERYQLEAKQVLAAHFLGTPKPASGTISMTEVRALVSAAVSEALANVLAQIGSGPRLPGPFQTVAMWLEDNMPDWDTTRAQRNQIAQDAKRLVECGKPGDVVGYYNRDLAFVGHQVACLARAAHKVYRKAVRENKLRTAPRLFDPEAA